MRNAIRARPATTSTPSVISIARTTSSTRTSVADARSLETGRPGLPPKPRSVDTVSGHPSRTGDETCEPRGFAVPVAVRSGPTHPRSHAATPKSPAAGRGQLLGRARAGHRGARGSRCSPCSAGWRTEATGSARHPELLAIRAAAAREAGLPRRGHGDRGAARPRPRRPAQPHRAVPPTRSTAAPGRGRRRRARRRTGAGALRELGLAEAGQQLQDVTLHITWTSTPSAR